MEERLKLFLVLLGANPRGRLVEQHDFFFGIGPTLSSLIPSFREYWPEAGDSLHIDGWREVSWVDGHSVTIQPNKLPVNQEKRLFFVNLGGYQTGRLEEQHYTLLTVQADRKDAIRMSTKSEFFKKNRVELVGSAAAHIDEKYGIDVDEFFRVEDALPRPFAEKYSIVLEKSTENISDEIHLGYIRLDLLSEMTGL